MSLKVTDTGPLIVQLSLCLKKMLLNIKVHSAVNLINNILKFSFEQIGVNLLGGNVLFDWLNNYHSNIELTIEVNSSTFLNTNLTNINCTYKFNVYWRNTKLPSPWTSKTLWTKRYEQNTINGDFNRSKRISSNLDEEFPQIKEKFMKTDYALRFINSVVNEFQKGKECWDENF